MLLKGCVLESSSLWTELPVTLRNGGWIQRKVVPQTGMIPRGPDQVQEHLASHVSGAAVMMISLLVLEKQRWEGYVVEERHKLEKPQTHGNLSCV